MQPKEEEALRVALDLWMASSPATALWPGLRADLARTFHAGWLARAEYELTLSDAERAMA